MRRRGLTPSTRLLGVELDRPPAEVAAALELGGDAPGLAAGPGPARRRPADRARERLVPRGAAARPRPARPRRLALRAVRRRLRPDHRHAPSRRCGARPPTPTLAAPPRRPGAHPAPGLPPRLAAPAAARSSTSSPATAATATRSTCPWAVTTSARAPPPKGTSSEHSRCVLGRRPPERRRFNLAPAPEVRPQPDAADRGAAGRGPAAAARAARPARRRRPRLGHASPPSSAPPATRSSRTCRCCSPSASRSAWPRRPTARPRWPRSSATWSSRASATRCRRSSSALPAEGEDAGADQLRRARRHRDGPDRRRTCGSATTGSSCRRTSRSSAAAGSSRSSPRSPRS